MCAYERATCANKRALTLSHCCCYFLHHMNDLLEEQESATVSGLVYATSDSEIQLELVETADADRRQLHHSVARVRQGDDVHEVRRRGDLQMSII